MILVAFDCVCVCLCDCVSVCLLFRFDVCAFVCLRVVVWLFLVVCLLVCVFGWLCCVFVPGSVVAYPRVVGYVFVFVFECVFIARVFGGVLFLRLFFGLRLCSFVACACLFVCVFACVLLWVCVCWCVCLVGWLVG